MIRVVLDTNVIVSALVFGGMPRAVLELAESGLCEFFYSKPIQTAVLRVLSQKFDWSPSILDRVLPVLWSMGRLVSPRTAINAVRDDPDNNRILECAAAARAHFIVSGDHHLLSLQNYKSIRVVTPRQFVDLFLAP